ncbi:MAG TPA: hypothetical protein VK308_14080 [Pyrinomonadaceae bacterium]|nr:hypothetical protein [Pyrinomonadaceae bacterium]
MLQEQLNFFQMFDKPPAPAAPTVSASRTQGTATAAATAKEEAVLSFVTSRQLEVLKTSPYAQFVRGKSLGELQKLQNSFDTKLWKNRDKSPADARRLEEWRTAFSSAQTVALESEYKKVDERFCRRENGFFHLVSKDGTETAVGYRYDPFHFDTLNTRTGTPTHHIEFKSEVPNEISSTGYRSNFFSAVPFSEVKNFADFLVHMLRMAFKVQATIVFEGVNYEFDASLIPAPAPKRKKSNCPECGDRLDRDGQCLDCDYTVGENDEEDEDFIEEEDEDLFDDE